MKRLSGHLSHFILIEMSTIWRLSEQIELMLNNDYRYPRVLPEHVCFSCWVEQDWFVSFKGRTSSQVQAWKYSRFKNHRWCHWRTSGVRKRNEISISITKCYRIFFIYTYLYLKGRLKRVKLHCKDSGFHGNEIFIINYTYSICFLLNLAFYTGRGKSTIHLFINSIDLFQQAYQFCFHKMIFYLPCIALVRDSDIKR